MLVYYNLHHGRSKKLPIMKFYSSSKKSIGIMLIFIMMLSLHYFVDEKKINVSYVSSDCAKGVLLSSFDLSSYINPPRHKRTYTSAW